MLSKRICLGNEASSDILEAVGRVRNSSTSTKVNHFARGKEGMVTALAKVFDSSNRNNPDYDIGMTYEVACSV